MFFGDQVAAFTNIATAIRPGGRRRRWSGRAWSTTNGCGNSQARWLPDGTCRPRRPGAPGQFVFADPGRGRAVLGAAGFANIALDGLAALMYFGADSDDAYAFVLGLTGWMLRGFDDHARGQAKDQLRATIAAHAGSSGVTYDSATWIITARKR